LLLLPFVVFATVSCWKNKQTNLTLVYLLILWGNVFCSVIFH
jgi:hypothetical protein